MAEQQGMMPSLDMQKLQLEAHLAAARVQLEQQKLDFDMQLKLLGFSLIVKRCRSIQRNGEDGAERAPQGV